MSKNNSSTIILQIKKNRLLLLTVFLSVFIGVTSVSYYVNGRTFKSGIEFYIFKSFVDDSKTDNNFLLSKEEIELLKSIASSDQLYHSIVVSEKLVPYYNKKFTYEAEETLRNATTITIDEHSKISIYVEDLDKYFAFSLADDIRKRINELYNDYSKSFKKSQNLKCERAIRQYTFEKQNIDRTFSKYPSSLLSLKFSTDSLNGPNYIKKITKFSQQTGIKTAEVMTILNLFHRLDKVEEQIYFYTDQKQQIQNSLFMLDRNHIFITNKNIHFRRSVDINSHFVLGLKVALLADIFIVLLLLLWKFYKNEIESLLNKNQ